MTDLGTITPPGSSWADREGIMDAKLKELLEKLAVAEADVRRVYGRANDGDAAGMGFHPYEHDEHCLACAERVRVSSRKYRLLDQVCAYAVEMTKQEAAA